MANYADLKAAIDVNIRNNGNGEITGDVLNQVLKNMVNVLGGGYQFAGAATTEMNPGTPDNNVYYVTTTAGTYTNFGGLVVNDGELALLTYNGTWQKVAVTLPTGGGGGSTTELKELKTGNTDEDKANNVAVVQSFLEGKAIPFIQENGDIKILSYGLVEEGAVVFLITVGTADVLENVGAIVYSTQTIIIIRDDGTYGTMQAQELHPQNAQILSLSPTSNFTDVVRIVQTQFAVFAQNASSIVVWNGNKPCVENESNDDKWIFGWFEDGILNRFIMNLNTGESSRVKVPNSYPLKDIVGTTETLLPGVFYKFTGGSLQIELTPPSVTDWVNEYVIKIVCTGTPNITLPSGLIWANDTAPVFTAGKTYVISIIDNLAVFAEFTTAS